MALSNELLYYKSHDGHNDEGVRKASGAYVFRPNGNKPHQIATPLPVLLASVVQVISIVRRDTFVFGKLAHSAVVNLSSLLHLGCLNNLVNGTYFFCHLVSPVDTRRIHCLCFDNGFWASNSRQLELKYPGLCFLFILKIDYDIIVD